MYKSDNFLVAASIHLSSNYHFSHKKAKDCSKNTLLHIFVVLLARHDIFNLKIHLLRQSKV